MGIGASKERKDEMRMAKKRIEKILAEEVVDPTKKAVEAFLGRLNEIAQRAVGEIKDAPKRDVAGVLSDEVQEPVGEAAGEMLTEIFGLEIKFEVYSAALVDKTEQRLTE